MDRGVEAELLSEFRPQRSRRVHARCHHRRRAGHDCVRVGIGGEFEAMEDGKTIGRRQSEAPHRTDLARESQQVDRPLLHVPLAERTRQRELEGQGARAVGLLIADAGSDPRLARHPLHHRRSTPGPKLLHRGARELDLLKISECADVKEDRTRRRIHCIVIHAVIPVLTNRRLSARARPCRDGAEASRVAILRQPAWRRIRSCNDCAIHYPARSTP